MLPRPLRLAPDMPDVQISSFYHKQPAIIPKDREDPTLKPTLPYPFPPYRENRARKRCRKGAAGSVSSASPGPLRLAP